MAVTFVESMDWMDTGLTGPNLTTHLLNRKGVSGNMETGDDATTIAGIGGNGTALRLAETGQFMRWPLAKTSVATDEVGMGAWIRASGNGSWFNTALFGLVDSDGLRFHMNLRVVGANGLLAVYRSSSFIAYTGFHLERGQWYWLEIKQVINNSTGSYEVRVDGVSVLSDTGVDTSDGGNGVVAFAQINGFRNGADRADFAGVIAWDDQGGNITDFPGKTTFVSLHPDADGDDEQWTTSSGTDSFALVNETAPHDDDTDYIEDTVSNNRTLFTYDNVSTNYSAILGIQINTVVRETDASDFTLINTFKSGGTLYPESSQAIAGQTFESLLNVLDQDPDTSAAWTVTNLNAVQAGVEVG